MAMLRVASNVGRETKIVWSLAAMDFRVPSKYHIQKLIPPWLNKPLGKNVINHH